jgi:ring-1,2-phenylacetyl-CoA epoxidase subunit PaaD
VIDDLRLQLATELVANLPDPEIPAVTLADLGILRSVSAEDDCLIVTLTPTYSGCPATEAIRDDVRAALVNEGFDRNQVRITLSPPWNTDWITDIGREKLLAYGIAPPAKMSSDQCLVKPTEASSNTPTNTPTSASILAFKAPDRGIQCPRCKSVNTDKLSQFGSTPCKALYRCLACREPFDYFKPF